MKKGFWKIDPIIFSIVGGSILGGALSCIFTLISTYPLARNYLFNIAGYVILSISGWFCNLISVESNNLRLLITGLPDVIKKNKTYDELIIEYSKSKNKIVTKQLIIVFFTLVIGMGILISGSLSQQTKAAEIKAQSIEKK